MQKKIIITLLIMSSVASLLLADTEIPKLPDAFQKYVDDLITKLGSSDWEVREKVTDELIMLGPIVRPKVAAVLNHDDAEVRLRAAHINFALRWKEAFTSRVDKFVAEVRHGTIQDVNLLTQCIQFLGTDNSVYMLVDILKDPNQSVETRRRIAEAFRNNVAVTLKPILADLIKVWQAEKDPSIRFSLIYSFPKAGRDEELTKVLTTALKGPDYNDRIAAISILGQLKEERALPDLLAMLETTDPSTKNTVIYALNNFRTPAVFEKILQSWKKETVPWLKSQTIQVLASYQDKRFLPELAELVKTEKDPQMLQNVANALYQLRSEPAAAPILLTLFRTGDANVRATALNIMRANNDRSVIPDLISRLENENDFGSFLAQLEGLQGFTGQRFTPQQIPPDIKNSIMKSVKEWWDKNKPR